jgi:uncharacterized membrane protein SirB2
VVDWPFVILSGYVRLASSLIACNLKCNPWCENKVLMPLLYLILMSCNWDVTFGRWLSNKWNWMFSYVNAIASFYCCIYLMHGLHHNLLGCCNYLMMQSYLW